MSKRDQFLTTFYILVGWISPFILNFIMMISLYIHTGDFLNGLLSAGHIYILFFLQTWAVIGILFIPKSRGVWFTIVAFVLFYLPTFRNVYTLGDITTMDSIYFYLNVVLKSPIWLVKFIINPLGDWIH